MQTDRQPQAGMSAIATSLSLRRRIIALMGVIFLIMTIVIVSGIQLFVSTTENKAWQERQNEAAHNAANEVAVYLQSNENVLYWLDKYGFDEIKDKSSISREILKDNPAFMEIAFLDASGNLQQGVARNRPVLSNQFTVLQSEWFRAASSGKKIYTRVQTSPQGESYLIFAMPSSHGGVVAAQIQMDELWDTVAGIHFGKRGAVYIVSQNGQVIAHPDRQIVLSNQNISDTAQFQAILRSPGNNWTGRAVGSEGLQVLSTSTAIESTDWIVIAELPQQEAHAASRLALILIPLGLLTLMAISTEFFKRTLVREFLQPVEVLRSGSIRLSQGDLAHRLETPRVMDELGEVMTAFNLMAAELEKQYHTLQTQADEIALSYQQAQTELSERQKAQAALKKLNQELEIRVQQRTATLTELNEDLSREVSERTKAEEKLLASLREKEVLLKEIHHRVKNNLQIISSLLNLQARQVTDAQSLRSLSDSQSRVRSMALIHEKLYQSQSLSKIDFGEYVNSLATDLFRSYQRGAAGVKLNVRVDEVSLDLDQAVPCGLILNELVTNALKYAFPDGNAGTIWVELSACPERVLSLRVADDGVGLPADLDIHNTRSLGLQLVNSLVAQVDGSLEVERSGGAAFRVSFGY